MRAVIGHVDLAAGVANQDGRVDVERLAEDGTAGLLEERLVSLFGEAAKINETPPVFVVEVCQLCRVGWRRKSRLEADGELDRRRLRAVAGVDRVYGRTDLSRGDYLAERPELGCHVRLELLLCDLGEQVGHVEETDGGEVFYLQRVNERGDGRGDGSGRWLGRGGVCRKTVHQGERTRGPVRADCPGEGDANGTR